MRINGLTSRELDLVVRLSSLAGHPLHYDLRYDMLGLAAKNRSTIRKALTAWKDRYPSETAAVAAIFEKLDRAS